ncbi:hypothetical protein KY366_03430 [Candidatus Woesearchaeota archaeon]|nr:hypothetical protein [Candidatus Woesearchaeota archaeon]
MDYLGKRCGLDAAYSEDPVMVETASRLISPQKARGVLYDTKKPEELLFAVISGENTYGCLHGRKNYDGNQIDFYPLQDGMARHMESAVKEINRQLKR